MNYLDFEIEISPDDGGHYSVAVIRSPAGEAREIVRFPSELQLESRLKDLEIALLRSGGKRRRVLSKEEQTVQKFGRELFDLLLPNELRGLYRSSLNKALEVESGLRLKLRLKEAPELAALPWEFLYDQNDGEYVCLSQDTSIVRYLELPSPPRPLTVTAPLRILGMVASPTNLPTLDVEREKERVNRAVADLQADGLVELVWLEGQTWRDLKKALRKKWHIFHFIGHGGFDRLKDEGFVALCDRNGNADNFTASQLARLLANQRALRMVLLNACEGGQGSGQDIFSSAASILVRRGMPAVLAMQYEITDGAAIELARSFYEALADGLPVDAAVTEARQSIGFATQGSIEWVTPVLYIRSPDGKLFDMRERETQPTIKAAPPLKPPIKKEPSPTKIHAPLESFTATYLAQLHKQLARAFSVEELKGLCFELGDVDYDDLEGSGKEGKARELIRYLDRRGRVSDLLTLCEEQRPKLNWREIVLREAAEPTRRRGGSLPDEKLAEKPMSPEPDQFTHEKTGLEFVRVPAGDFLYGDNKEKRTLPEYWMCKTPVTNAAYKRLVTDWKYEAGKENHPVVRVSWRDAVAFCEKAELELPTEEQWEKAARGTDGRTYPWGNGDPTDKLCNFDGNVGDTTPVGNYSPQGDSPYGCVDMSGNVWEWCLNKYFTPEDTSIDKSDDFRVIRGGSFYDDSGASRAASRYHSQSCLSPR